MDSFDKIIGYESIKSELRRICDIICNPGKYERMGVREPKGLLLHGVPGVGKTLMAECFIEASGRECIVCRKKKADGEFVDEIRETFEKAKEKSPCIVFLDDMDKFANEDENHRNAEEFVTIQSCIDDVKGMKVFVLATANSMANIPDSLLRAGRFDKSVSVDTPVRKEAEKIIAYYLSKISYMSDIDPGEIAGIMDGHSCATLETVINEAGIYAGFENKEHIEMKDVIRACLRVLYDAPEDTDENEKNIEAIAYHEAGHVVLGELLNPGTVNLVSVRGDNNGIGGFTSSAKPDDYWFSKKEMDNRVLSILGGKAATEIVYGIVDVGSEDDLRRAYSVVDRMVSSYGSNGFEGYLRRNGATNSDLKRYEKDRYVSFELEHYYEQARKLLIENRNSLDRVAKALIEERILTGSQVRELI